MKEKILHILWSGEIGGTEDYVISLLKSANRSKYDIYLCFLAHKGPIYEEALKIMDNVIYLDMNSGVDLRGAFRIWRLLREQQFDIIHSHSTNILTNALIALFRKPKKIFSEHVSPGARDAFRKRKLFYKLFSKMYQRVIAISETVKREVVVNFHLNPDKVEVIHNGVQLEKFSKHNSSLKEDLYARKGDRYVIGFVGRMVGFKRPQLFIEIAAELLKENKSFYFVMAGDGPEMDNCRNMINRYEINESFELLGFRRDIPDVLKMFNAFLFTSECEGFGIVLIEAMAMGIPVFAVNDGAVPEIISHEINGVLLNSIDPKKAARQISTVIKDEQLIGKIKKQCVEDVYLKFSVKASIELIEKVYDAVAI